MGTVVARNIVYRIDDTPYWHLAAQSSFIRHNAKLAEGICASASLFARSPGLEQATSPYAFGHQDREKEAVFESARQREFADRPSRMKALFLFDSREQAVKAQQSPSWFSREERVLLEARIVAGSNTHRADALWLESRREEWEASARRYWAGEMGPDPWPEVIVDGMLFFPEWETFSLWKP